MRPSFFVSISAAISNKRLGKWLIYAVCKVVVILFLMACNRTYPHKQTVSVLLNIGKNCFISNKLVTNLFYFPAEKIRIV